MEDYKKKYDELLLKLQKAKVDDNVCDERYCCVIDDIVPELKENEDENIRKTLIDFFNRGAENGAQTNGVCDKDIIAWLEKQGEQDPYNGVSFKYNGHTWGMCARDNGVDILLDRQLIKHLEKQGEQVSAIRWYDASFIPQEYKELLVEWNSSDATWHDVAFYHADTKTFRSYERELKNVTRWCYVEDLYWEQSNVKETGISQHDEKTCVEWSEEDKVILDEIIDFFENGTVKLQHDLSLYASWLKSLKQRYTWKPSDEQIKALEHFVRSVGESGYASPYENNAKLLYSLLEQLKKLK